MRLFILVTGVVWLLAGLASLHSLATRTYPYTKVERSGSASAIALLINFAVFVWAAILLWGMRP